MLKLGSSQVPYLRWAGGFASLAPIFCLIVLQSCQSAPTTAADQAQPAPNLQPTVIPTLMVTTTTAEQDQPATNRILQPTVLPTLTVTSPAEQFSLEGANKPNPGDVLAEIYVGGKGGGGLICDEVDHPVMNNSLNTGTALLLMQIISVEACGWKDGERVNLLIQYPDGRQENQQVTAEWSEEAYGVTYTFLPTLQDPPGVYQFTYTGQSGSASKSLEITRPQGPYAYWFGDGRLFLYQLQPGERVRLHAYKNCTDTDPCVNAMNEAKVVGWQDYHVDSDGSLWISIDYNKPGSTFDFLIVIGEKSGETWPMMIYSDQSIEPLQLPRG